MSHYTATNSVHMPLSDSMRVAHFVKMLPAMRRLW